MSDRNYSYQLTLEEAREIECARFVADVAKIRAEREKREVEERARYWKSVRQKFRNWIFK
jgi:hypothetical protein